MKFTVVFPAFMLLIASISQAAPDCSALSQFEIEAILDANESSPAGRSVAYSSMAVECEKQAQALDDLAVAEKNGKKSMALTMKSVKARNNSTGLLQQSQFVLNR